MTEWIRVLEVSRAPAGEDGYICIGDCGFPLTMNPKAVALILTGGHVICHECARELREVSPHLFIQAESQN